MAILVEAVTGSPWAQADIDRARGERETRRQARLRDGRWPVEPKRRALV
jgi:hypothetical protein